MANLEHKHEHHHVDEPTGNNQPDSMDHDMHHEHAGHQMPDHSAHAMHDMQAHQDTKSTEHTDHAHHADHSGHEQMFRRRFWGSLLLSMPVLLFSSMIQELLGFRIPSFTGSEWIPFLFALIV